MDYYLMTLNAIKKLFVDIGMTKYSDVVGEWIEKWKKDGDCDAFRKTFDANGVFANFRIDTQLIPNVEKCFWTANTFSALIAMSAQLAFFYQKNIEPEIDFMRKHFGIAGEVMTVSKCSDCGRLEATLTDIDKYISKPVIAKRIVDGMENGNLDEQVEALINAGADEIKRERRKVITRLENSSIPYVESYGRVKSCLKCGKKNITEGKLLKSMNENIFIPLKK